MSLSSGLDQPAWRSPIISFRKTTREGNCHCQNHHHHHRRHHCHHHHCHHHHQHHTKVGAVRGGKSASISSGTQARLQNQAQLQTTSGGIDFTEAVILIVKIYHHNTDTDDILSYFHRVKDPS